jgi:hypothetical protein
MNRNRTISRDFNRGIVAVHLPPGLANFANFSTLLNRPSCCPRFLSDFPQLTGNGRFRNNEGLFGSYRVFSDPSFELELFAEQ